MQNRIQLLCNVLLLLPRGVASTLATLPKLCPSCLAEPLETAYFGGQLGGEPPRLTAPTAAAFEEAARSGKVLIIEKVSAGTSLGGWTCQRFAEAFPKARMRREYDWIRNPEDKNLQLLGSSAWITKQEAGEGKTASLQHDQKVPPFAPFYWGVREHGGRDLGSEEAIKEVKDLIKKSVPAFMDQENAQSLFQNAEFWFGAKGTGARAHMDSHCMSTLSVVLSGARRWRVGPPPRMPRGAGRSPDGENLFDDGVAYELKWKPMFEFTVKEGEAVLFPPGWIHETLNTAEGCTAALTTQFASPLPVRYYRSFYQRLRRVGDLQNCWPMMRRWARPEEHLPPGVAAATASKMAKEGSFKWSSTALDFFDADGDGTLSEQEISGTMKSWQATEHAIQRERQVLRPRVDMSFDPPRAASIEL